MAESKEIVIPPWLVNTLLVGAVIGVTTWVKVTSATAADTLDITRQIPNTAIHADQKDSIKLLARKTQEHEVQISVLRNEFEHIQMTLDEHTDLLKNIEGKLP